MEYPYCACEKEGQIIETVCRLLKVESGLTKNDAYPMPRLDKLIDCMGKARFISTLDLTGGYWQVTVASCG